MYSENHRAEKQRAATRRYREKHADQLKAERDTIRESGIKRVEWKEKTRQWRQKNRERCKTLDARWYQNAKDKAFDALGNKCVVCGWTDRRALQIDHKTAIGDEERRRKNHRGTNLYRAVLKNPEAFQLLCANHNWIKRHENKEHLKKRLDSRNTPSA